MLTGTYSNVRTAFRCQSSLNDGFNTGLRSGNIMGFFLVIFG